MAITIRISQKHVERLAFSLIIIILLGMLVNEKYSEPSTDLPSITGQSIRGLLPTTNDDDTSVTTTTITTTTGSITSTTSPATTTTSSTTTTTNMQKDLIFAIEDIAYEKLDDDKGKIMTFYVDVKNGLSKDVDLTLKYFLYDADSSVFERQTAKKPYLELGTIKAGEHYRKKFEINRYVFNLDLQKTMKFQLVDEDQDIEKTAVKKFKVI